MCDVFRGQAKFRRVAVGWSCVEVGAQLVHGEHLGTLETLVALHNIVFNIERLFSNPNEVHANQQHDTLFLSRDYVVTAQGGCV